MRRIVALVAALASAFFVFYTFRLFAVTAFLTRLRPGGGRIQMRPEIPASICWFANPTGFE